LLLKSSLKHSLTASVCTDIPKTLEPLQNPGGQNSDMKEVPYRGPTNIRQHTKRFSRGGDLETGPCAPLV